MCGAVYCVISGETGPLAGFRPGPANTWDTLGYAHYHLGHHTEALACYATALTLFRGLGDRHQEAGIDVLNKAHNGLRAIGERGNALLKMTFRALRNISLNPWRIGDIVAAALTILHFDHARTT
jgi:hypothetical protein